MKDAARAVLGVLVALVLLELAARWSTSGQVHLPLYAYGGGAGIQLRPGATASGRMPSGARYDVHIDALGLRAPTPAQPIALLAGDSAAFGVGVADGQTLAARLTAGGVPTANAGVPAFTVGDTLAHAGSLADPLRVERTVVLLNPADDHLDTPAPERFHVAGGWLVGVQTPAFLRTLIGSPLGRLQLVTRTLDRLNALRSERPAPHWHTDPDGGEATFHAVGARIRDFAARHPTCVVWMPFDAVLAPDRARPSAVGGPIDDTAALRGLRTGLGDVPLVAPRPTEPSTWLPGDLHLAPAGLDRLADDVLAGCFR